jgi:hypothetical protein
MASEDPTEMVWEKRWVGRPVGTHYSAGGSSPLARRDGTNKLETHATLGSLVDEDGKDQSATVLMAAIALASAVGLGVGVTIAARKTAPRIKSLWNDIKSRWNSRSETSEAGGQAATAEMAALSTMVPADFANEVEAALEEHRTRMSSAEAQLRLLAVLMAAAFIADQMRALSSARIEDDASLELRSAMEKLTAAQLTDSVNRMLEANASLLDDETSAELMKIFGGGRLVDGQYVPLRNEKIKAALRLTDGEM